MNDLIFFITLIVLTIAHVIGDFRTPYRTFDRTSWKTMLLSEYVLVLNPMHGLWDRFSPWRRHPRYLTPYNKIEYSYQRHMPNAPVTTSIEESIAPEIKYCPTTVKICEGHKIHAPSWHAQNSLFIITNRRFWVWLGIDQAYHMLSNIFVAWLLAVLL